MTEMNAPTVVADAAQCSLERAEELTHQLQQSLEISWNLLREAFDLRAWAAMGYESWEAYCDKELRTGLLRLGKELRREAVAELASGDRPMSNRAIASALGVDEGTVRNDRRVAGAEFSAPDAEPNVVEAEILEEPGRRLTVVGTDGKTYTHRSRPLVPAATTKSLTRDWRAAEITLTKVTKEFKRLVQADPFATHTAHLGREDLRRAADRIAAVLAVLPEAEDA